MKVWRSVRHQACAAHAVGVGGLPVRGRRQGRVRVQRRPRRDRSRRSVPSAWARLTSRASASPAASSTLLSATGACTCAKCRPTLCSGAQCEGRATASQGMCALRASISAKSSAKASDSRPARRQAGGSWREAGADLGHRREVAGAGQQFAAAHRPAQQRARWRCRRPSRRLQGVRWPHARPARAAGQRVEAGHALQGRGRWRIQRLQLLAQMPTVARVRVQLARAFGQAAQPGCMRNGACTAATKSKASARAAARAAHAGAWHTASTLLPSGSSTKAP